MLFVDCLEDYLELFNVVEDVVVELGCLIVIEGYFLFFDFRFNYFKIILDLGVIEVNVQLM